MIDTHVHLTDPVFGTDLDRVIEAAHTTGVQKIITVAINEKDSLKCIHLSQNFPGILATTGVHPHEANTWTQNSLANIRQLSQSTVAIGEIGLDYFYNYAEPEHQKSVFRQQLHLANDISKPVVIHCRDAFADLKHILKSFRPGKPGGVVHCFSGSYEDASFLVDQGFYVSFTGILTFRNAEEIRQTALAIPEDRIFFETDSPWMSPHPFRGKRNTPDKVRFVYEKYAALKGIPTDSIVRKIRHNVVQCFSLE